MFTVQQVSELSENKAQEIRNWLANGLVEAVAREGRGRGASHLFSRMQTVGWVVAGELRQLPHGCVPAYVAAIVKAFGDTDEDWLKHEFSSGRTLFARVHQGHLILSAAGEEFGWPNVLDAHSRVIASEA